MPGEARAAMFSEVPRGGSGGSSGLLPALHTGHGPQAADEVGVVHVDELPLDADQVGHHVGGRPGRRADKTIWFEVPTQKKTINITPQTGPKVMFKTKRASNYVAVGQDPVPLVNIKVAGKWMFIHLKWSHRF